MKRRFRPLWAFLALFAFAAAPQAQAQFPLDSLVGPPLPEEAFLPLDPEDEIVPAATSAPAYLPSFDTTYAIDLTSVPREVDYLSTVSEELIRDRLSCLELDVPLDYHERVRVFIDYFTIRRRDFTEEIIRRKNMYFPMFDRVTAEHDMPEELRYLAVIESALAPEALSRVGAKGLWQFMPSTGRMYGLRRNYYIDERMDPEKATHAACEYLRDLYAQFGDWQLAMAAYNCGPGNVRRAIRRSGYKKSFWEIYWYLPRETRSYVPQYIAMAYVLQHAEDHQFAVEYPYFPIPSETVYVSQFVNLNALAEELDVCFDDLTRLNPELRKFVVPPYAKNYPLKIPSARAKYFEENRERILEACKQRANAYPTSYRRFSSYERKRSQRSSASVRRTPTAPSTAYRDPSHNTAGKKKIYHTIRSGETLGHIAEKYGCLASDLRHWNQMYRSRIYAGKRLVVWVKPELLAKLQGGNGSSQSPKLPSVSQKPPKGRVYVVQRGDNLWEIARKFDGVTVEQIKQLNDLRSNSLTPGQRLVIE